MSNKKIMQRKYDAPQYAMRTARRLFSQLKDQRFRLMAVAVSILIYTVLNIFTPYYSAIVIDALKAAIDESVAAGKFVFAWEPLGRDDHLGRDVPCDGVFLPVPVIPDGERGGKSYSETQKADKQQAQ